MIHLVFIPAPSCDLQWLVYGYQPVAFGTYHQALPYEVLGDGMGQAGRTSQFVSTLKMFSFLKKKQASLPDIAVLLTFHHPVMISPSW